MAGFGIAANAAKRGFVHRIKKMLNPVARLVSRSAAPKPSKARVPKPQPTEADLDNLANEALEQKLCSAQNAANEERVRVLLLQLAAVATPCRCHSAHPVHSDADLWPAPSTLSRRQRAEQQRPL